MKHPHNFFDDNMLPVGVALNDPSKIKKDDCIAILHYWIDAQEGRGDAAPFRFKNYTTANRHNTSSGTLLPAKYEVMGESNTEKRRRQKGKGRQISDEDTHGHAVRGRGGGCMSRRGLAPLSKSVWYLFTHFEALPAATCDRNSDTNRFSGLVGDEASATCCEFVRVTTATRTRYPRIRGS